MIQNLITNALVCPHLHQIQNYPPTRRSSDLQHVRRVHDACGNCLLEYENGYFSGSHLLLLCVHSMSQYAPHFVSRSEEHTSELQSRENLVCRLLHEKTKIKCKSNLKGY